MNRSDAVLVRVPHPSGVRGKRRPAPTPRPIESCACFDCVRESTTKRRDCNEPLRKCGSAMNPANHSGSTWRRRKGKPRADTARKECRPDHQVLGRTRSSELRLLLRISSSAVGMEVNRTRSHSSPLGRKHRQTLMSRRSHKSPSHGTNDGKGAPAGYRATVC